MSLAVAPVASSVVVVNPDLLARLTALRQTLAPTLTDPELELFALVAQRKGLDPFSGQIRAIKRDTRHGPVVAYQTGIDGYRSIAERTNQYLGSLDAEFGDDCPCGAQPDPHPKFSRVVVRRWHPSGQVVEQPGRADWHEFKPGDDFMWRDKPHLMIAKCAEAQALRKAFPWVLGDLYIPEELAREVSEADDAGPVLTPRQIVAARAAAIQDQEGEQPDEPAGEAAPDVEPAGSPEPLRADQFQERVQAAGITRAQVRGAAVAMFPTTPAQAMTDEQWGALWERVSVNAQVPGSD